MCPWAERVSSSHRMVEEAVDRGFLGKHPCPESDKQ